MMCRVNVNRDGDTFDGVSPGFTVKGGHFCGLCGVVLSGGELNHGEHGGHGEPLVLLGPGGEYARPMSERQIGEAFFPSRGGKLVLTNAHIARIGIADDAVVIRNAAPGLEVDWNIPAAVGEAAQAIEQKVKWGVGVVEAFCAGAALAIVAMTVMVWVVS